MSAIKGVIRTAIRRRHDLRPRKPMRQVHMPDLCAYVSPEAIGTAARAIADRIRKLRREHGGVAYVFVSPSGAAIVLGELHTALPQWIADHADWLIGGYVADRKRTTLLQEMIEDDLGAYMAGVEAVRGSGMVQGA